MRIGNKLLVSGIIGLYTSFCLAGNPNLLKNSSFELGTANFAMNSWVFPDKGMNTPAVKPRFDTTTKIHGNVSMKIDNSHGDIFRLISGELKLVPGTTHTMSAWMKSDSAGYPVRFVVESVAPGSKWNSHVKAFLLTKQWKRYSFSFKTPANGLHTFFNVRIESNISREQFTANNVRVPGIVWLDALELNRGSLEKYIPYANIEAAFLLDKKFPLYNPGENVSGRIVVFQYAGAPATRLVTYSVVNDYYNIEMQETNVEVGTTAGKTVTVPVATMIDKRGGYALKGVMKLAAASGAQASSAGVYAIPNAYFAVSENAGSEEWISPNIFSLGVNMTVFPNSIWGSATHGYVLRKKDGFDSPFKWYASEGIRWIRDWGGRPAFTWSDIEPERGKYNWTVTDYVVGQIEKHHMRILPVLGGGGFQRRTTHRWQIQVFPKWVLERAETMPSMNQMSASKGWKRVFPRIEDWKNYIKAVVSRYKGRITHYEVMNEPNLYLEPKQYVKYLKAAYEAAKSVDPQCKIVGFCSTGDLGGQLIKFIDECCKLGALKFCDIVSFHPYHARLTGTPVSAQKMIHDLRKLLNEYGEGNKPLWNTELYYMSTKQQSGFDASIYKGDAIARRYLIDLGEGLRQSMPLAYMANSRRTVFKNRHMGFPAVCIPSARFVIYAQLARHFEGAKPVTRLKWPNRDVCYVFEKQDRMLAAVWNYDETRRDFLNIPLPASRVEILDMFGNTVKLKKSKEISLELGNEPFYIFWNGKNGNEFIDALKTASIRGDKSVSLSGVKIDEKALVLDLENTTGAPIKGLAKIMSAPSWLKTDRGSVAYGPVPPHGTVQVRFRVSMEPGKSRTGVVSVALSTEEELLEFSADVFRPLLLKSMKLPRSPKINGRIDSREWGNADTVTLDKIGNVKVGTPARWRGANDCSAVVRSGYDGDNIYFAVAVKDDLKGSRLKEVPWTGDAVELFLDISTEPGAHYTDDTYQFFFAPRSGKNIHPLAVKTKGRAAFKIDDISWSSSRGKNGYTIELAIPFSALGLKSAEVRGKSIGFDVAIDDADKGQRETQMVWSGDGNNYKDRSRFGRLVFER